MSAAQAILRDLRLALLSLRRAPGFTLIAIVTLALGIGANTSMFSLLNAYILRPLPYPDSDRLDRIYRATSGDSTGGVSPADYLDLEAEASPYGEITGYVSSSMSVAEPGKPAELALGLRAAADLFPVLGARPHLGRVFRADEEIVGNHRVLVLSHRYWQNHFGGDRDILGRAVRVDGEPYEIVGVMPADFSDWRHLRFADVFRPLAFDERERRDRTATSVRLLGRRAVDEENARAAISDFGRRRAADFPAVHADTIWRVVPLQDSFLFGTGRAMIAMLVGLSGFVLLIACSNLANLLLARTVGRARELALRAALGASRVQTLRPLLLESLLLAFAGGALALLVAQWTFDWIAAASAGDSGVGVDLVLDRNVLAWAFAACLFTAVAFGVAPAFFAQRLDLTHALKSGGRGTIGGRGHQRFRHALIVGQFTLATVLLAGAALFVDGFRELSHRREGWESASLVTGTVVLPSTGYRDDREVADFHERAIERLQALPGVASASFSQAMPFFGLGEKRRYVAGGVEAPPRGREPLALTNAVTPDYFATLGTRLLEGRPFDARDRAGSPRVFIINQSMARGLFGSGSALGRRLARADGETVEWGRIVGVAADVESLDAERPGAGYQIYQPLAQEPRRASELAVRTAGVAPVELVDDVRTAMMALDPDLPIRRLQPADKTIARANYQLGVLNTLLSSLALLGLGLAALGVYGVIARTTAQRTGEFGIRLALGAQAAEVLRMVLASGARLALLGCGLGLLGAFGVARLFALQFPGLRTDTVPVLSAVTLVLVAVAQIAGYLPARQASQVDPAQTLRAE